MVANARFRRRSTHVCMPNQTDELHTAKERRLNLFGTAVKLIGAEKAFSSS